MEQKHPMRLHMNTHSIPYSGYISRGLYTIVYHSFICKGSEQDLSQLTELAFFPKLFLSLTSPINRMHAMSYIESGYICTYLFQDLSRQGLKCLEKIADTNIMSIEELLLCATWACFSVTIPSTVVALCIVMTET